MKVFLWVLREAGVHNVPSFASLRGMQSDLRGKCGIPTHQYKSAQGNVYFMNDLQKIIAKVCYPPETDVQGLMTICLGLCKPFSLPTPPLLPRDSRGTSNGSLGS
jgi:hypothetical protein